MTTARTQQVDVNATPYYHCMARCVRRAFLCGEDRYSGKNFDHRKVWVVERLRFLAEVFAIDMCAYAVMENHLHVVLRVDRERADSWSDEEVIERFGRLFGASKKTIQLVTAKQRARRVALWRERLWSLSWMMRCLNEHIARRANREDQCRGRFWEGRFRSQALLDEGALLTCMSYVDLNPVRAGSATSLLNSAFTSIQERLRALGKAKKNGTPVRAPKGLAALVGERSSTAAAGDRIPISLVDYVALLEWTGRALRSGKRGAITGPPPGLLEQKALDPSAWLDAVTSFGQRFFVAAGASEKLDARAKRHGLRWCRGKRHARRMYQAA